LDANILIVDDIAANIQVLGSILGEQGYAISYATDGPQALEMIEAEDYDLILLDIMMPAMDGFEVCRRIQKIPQKDNIPVIFLTARNEKKDIVDGLTAGAVDYVTKPFSSAELLARVTTHLQLKAATDRIARQNRELTRLNHQLHALNDELKASLDRIQTLEGIIPICSICKQIRDDEGYWKRIELYFQEHSDVQFSHSLCPECLAVHYPDIKLDEA
jgi:DNA-binding response OmpR family regulator